MNPIDGECLVSVNVANLYGEPSSGGERVTQALMGDRVTVIQTQDKFCLVQTSDRYEGWVGEQHLVAAWDDGDYFPTSIATLFADVFSQPHVQSEMRTKLTVGTRVLIAHRATVDDWVPLLLPDKQVGYTHQVCLNMTHDGSIAGPDLLDQKARRSIDLQGLKRQVLMAVGRQASQVALRFIGTPYLWGGSSSFGIDCSALVQLAYKLSGVQLLRDADLQWRDRRFMPVEENLPLEEADLSAGDLVVFSKLPRENGMTPRPTHVGIALGDGRFVHASGRRNGVYLESCSEEAYNNTYLGTVRISADADLAIEAA